MDAKINEFIETWTPPGHVEATEGEFERDLRELMESYHQHRQAEEAQERYKKAREFYYNYYSINAVQDNSGVERSWKIAAGIEGKEEG